MNRVPTSHDLRVAALVVALATAGCLGRGVFHCGESRDCGPGAYCEATTSACSVPDATCPSERRYVDHAPEQLAGQCVQDACPSNPVVELHAGGAHACLLRHDGRIECWGAGANGQLGDGTRATRSTVAPVQGLDGKPALHVALGDRHTCALVGDPASSASSIVCFGANEAGQLGNGTLTDSLAPVAGPGLVAPSALAAGAAFTCALSGGAVACWGANDVGQLGNGDTSPSSPAAPAGPSPVAVPEPVAAIAARDRHACALSTTGNIYCWGSNGQGELGDGTTVDRPAPKQVPQVQGATAVVTGTTHTCALVAGSVFCWGANQVGQLGDGTDSSRSTPGLVQTLSHVTALAAGAYHTCATNDDGTVACWGANQAGQLGEGTTSNIGVPVPTSGIQLGADVAAGDTFTCVRRKDGTVGCWGDNRQGQLGTQAVIGQLVPTAVGALPDVRAVSAAGDHTCAVQRGATASVGTALCWGHNQAGEIGDNTRVDRPAPTPLKIALDAADIAAGLSHTCLRASDGAIWCWGRGGSGQLGGTSTIDMRVPASVSGVAGALAIAAGGAHTCALVAGTPICWGAGTDGQLGDGTMTDRSKPGPVPGVADAVALRLGAAHTCALRAGGGVACWGANDHGQLGNDGMTSSATPVEIPYVAGAVSLAAGDRHTCVVSGNGTASCWGAGASGQLGWSGPLIDHSAASQVAGLTGAVEIVAGANHTCARLAFDLQATTPGPVMCWGSNSDGQLGDGTRNDRPMAVAAAGLPDAIALAAGRAHTCALRQDHTLMCWGSDSAGQLGDGGALQFSVPQPTDVPCP